MVILDMVGRRGILFPYTLSTGDIQDISVHAHVLTRGLVTMPVGAKLLHNCCSSLRTRGIFANGVGACAFRF